MAIGFSAWELIVSLSLRKSSGRNSFLSSLELLYLFYLQVGWFVRLIDNVEHSQRNGSCLVRPTHTHALISFRFEVSWRTDPLHFMDTYAIVGNWLVFPQVYVPHIPLWCIHHLWPGCWMNIVHGEVLGECLSLYSRISFQSSSHVDIKHRDMRYTNILNPAD